MLFVLDLVGLWVPRRALGSQRGNPRKIGKGLKNRVGVEKNREPWIRWIRWQVVRVLKWALAYTKR